MSTEFKLKKNFKWQEASKRIVKKYVADAKAIYTKYSIIKSKRQQEATPIK